MKRILSNLVGSALERVDGFLNKAGGVLESKSVKVCETFDQVYDNNIKLVSVLLKSADGLAEKFGIEINTYYEHLNVLLGKSDKMDFSRESVSVFINFLESTELKCFVQDILDNTKFSKLGISSFTWENYNKLLELFNGNKDGNKISFDKFLDYLADKYRTKFFDHYLANNSESIAGVLAGDLGVLNDELLGFDFRYAGKCFINGLINGKECFVEVLDGSKLILRNDIELKNKSFIVDGKTVYFVEVGGVNALLDLERGIICECSDSDINMLISMDKKAPVHFSYNIDDQCCLLNYETLNEVTFDDSVISIDWLLFTKDGESYVMVKRDESDNKNYGCLMSVDGQLIIDSLNGISNSSGIITDKKLKFRYLLVEIDLGLDHISGMNAIFDIDNMEYFVKPGDFDSVSKIEGNGGFKYFKFVKGLRAGIAMIKKDQDGKNTYVILCNDLNYSFFVNKSKLEILPDGKILIFAHKSDFSESFYYTIYDTVNDIIVRNGTFNIKDPKIHYAKDGRILLYGIDMFGSMQRMFCIYDLVSGKNVFYTNTLLSIEKGLDGDKLIMSCYPFIDGKCSPKYVCYSLENGLLFEGSVCTSVVHIDDVAGGDRLLIARDNYMDFLSTDSVYSLKKGEFILKDSYVAYENQNGDSKFIFNESGLKQRTHFIFRMKDPFQTKVAASLFLQKYVTRVFSVELGKPLGVDIKGIHKFVSLKYISGDGIQETYDVIIVCRSSRLSDNDYISHIIDANTGEILLKGKKIIFEFLTHMSDISYEMNVGFFEKKRGFMSELVHDLIEKKKTGNNNGNDDGSDLPPK